jgi:hypothetical protein
MEPLQVVIERDSEEHSGSVSQDNPDRKEVLWEPQLEALCDKWKDDCMLRSKQHDTKAKTHKQRFATLKAPIISTTNYANMILFKKYI